MIRAARAHLGAAALALALAACASAPLHYYTLVPPAAGTPARGAAPLRFELLPVGIPAQVDQPQLVVRQGGQDMAVLEGERWIAPLGDELRAALSAGLARELGGQDVSGLPGGGDAVLRIKLDVRRFESWPGRYALVEAAWSVRPLKAGDGAVLACASTVREPVDGQGYPALVQAHQRAVARLAADIAAAARPFAAGQAARCPE